MKSKRIGSYRNWFSRAAPLLLRTAARGALAYRNSYKKTGSSTAVRYRKKRKLNPSSPYVSAGFMSRNIRKRYRRRRRRRVSPIFNVNPPSNIIYNNISGILETSNGLQSYKDLDIILDKDSFLNLAYRLTDGSVTNDSLSSTNYQMYLTSISRSAWFRNQANCQCVLYLYECVNRDATSTNPVTSIVTGLQHNTSGLTPATNAVYEATALVSPFGASDFTRRWKVWKKHRIVLDPGQVYNHKVYIKLNKMVSSTQLNDDVYYPYLTHTLLARVHGVPVNPPNSSVVSLSECKVDYVIGTAVNGKILQKALKRTQITTNLPTLAAQQVMVDESGESKPYTEG